MCQADSQRATSHVSLNILHIGVGLWAFKLDSKAKNYIT